MVSVRGYTMSLTEEIQEDYSYRLETVRQQCISLWLNYFLWP